MSRLGDAMRAGSVEKIRTLRVQLAAKYAQCELLGQELSRRLATIPANLTEVGIPAVLELERERLSIDSETLVLHKEVLSLLEEEVSELAAAPHQNPLVQYLLCARVRADIVWQKQLVQAATQVKSAQQHRIDVLLPVWEAYAAGKESLSGRYLELLATTIPGTNLKMDRSLGEGYARHRILETRRAAQELAYVRRIVAIVEAS